MNKFIDELKSYKTEKEELDRLKKEINADYMIFKETYKKATSNPLQLAKNSIRALAHPGEEAILASEYQRFANINIEMTRLFNSYITIYQTAFNTKLSEMKNKYENNKLIIATILAQTGIFSPTDSAVTKTAKWDKPIPYAPSIKT